MAAPSRIKSWPIIAAWLQVENSMQLAHLENFIKISNLLILGHKTE